MKGKPCYFCGGQATSKEHVPPQMMFKGQGCDSITVPACDSHNNDKSGEDQAVIHGFLLSLLKVLNQYSLNQKTQDAALKAEPHFKYSKKITQSIAIIPGGPEFAHTTANVDGWMRQLTAALVYDALEQFDPNIPWEKAQVFSLNYIKGNISTASAEKLKQAEESLGIEKSLKSMQWLNGWSPKPSPWPSDLYSFEFCTTPETTWFKHIFYESYEWYVRFPNTFEISTALTKKVSP